MPVGGQAGEPALDGFRLAEAGLDAAAAGVAGIGEPARAARVATPWRRSLLDLLDRLAGELPAGLQCSAEALHGDAVALLVGLTSAALAAERDNSRAERLQAIAAQCERPSGLGAWQGLLALARELDFPWLSAGAGQRLEALAQLELSQASVRQLLDISANVGRLARAGIEAPAEQLGALYELLLGVRFERLTQRALRLKPTRYWIQPEEILAWPRALRAKRLQRTAGLSKRSVEQLSDVLACARTATEIERALLPLLDSEPSGRTAGSWVLQPGVSQRRSGAHYTPWSLCVSLVERTLQPLVAGMPSPRSHGLLELKLCDPAMGAGAFLLAAGEYLARALVDAWLTERASGAPLASGSCSGGGEGQLAAAELHARARRLVAERVLLGVDKDPIAVVLARLALTLFAEPSLSLPPDLSRNLRCGDALVGEAGVPLSRAPTAGVARARGSRARQAEAAVARVLADPSQRVFDWAQAFPEPFASSQPGLDVLIGNPPWVAFAGRAAQPLAPDLFEYFAATNPAFKRYRTLHGLFVYRCATLLRSGGRLGLVLPTSVADLAGYRETRQAHDALCDVDDPLPDWGDGVFDGVFQPAMALVSTRRGSAPVRPQAAIWPLAQGELSQAERRLLAYARSLPRLPQHLFGERGFQTTEEDQAHLRRLPAPLAPFTLALREGTDVREFRALAPTLFVDRSKVAGRLRAPEQWQRVALLIRQTARYPIAGPSDGTAFRNSVLAGFEDEEWPAAVLLCYLNSTLARWLHYTEHRDARQGMPQLKIAHLRALPALPSGASRVRGELMRLGTELILRNAGVSAEQRELLERLVGEAFALDGEQREALGRWQLAHPLPEPRRSARGGEQAAFDSV